MDDNDGRRLKLSERLAVFFGTSNEWTQSGIVLLAVVFIIWLASFVGMRLPPVARGEYGGHDREFREAQQKVQSK